MEVGPHEDEEGSPSERFRSELDEVPAGVGAEQERIETIGSLGALLLLQQALEDKVSEFLGRARCERTEETVSHRNGYGKDDEGQRRVGAPPGCARRGRWGLRGGCSARA